MIAQEQLHEIVRMIVENFEPQRIILFGSYANGTPTEESDVDLLIIKDSDVSPRLQSRQVRRLLAPLKLPVDVIVKSSTEFETYKDIVGTVMYPANRFGKVIYESG